MTREAVRSFQVAKKLNPTGLIDGETWNVLNKAYKALPAVVPGSTTTTSSGAELSLGAEGLAVRELQSRLKVLGFFAPDITGYFGPITRAAVIAFQNARGIDPVGFVGPKTKAALSLNEASATPTPEEKYIFIKNLSLGSTGTEVEELQKKLKLLGHLNLTSFTTYFGPLTEKAVIAFQKAEGIDPAGVVGPKTRMALNNK